MIIAQALKDAAFLLQGKVPRPRYEAELLLAYHLGVKRAYLLLNDDRIIENKEGYFALIKKRVKNEPYEYIVNKVSFYDIELYVDERVLIPRPETELLIDEAKKLIERHKITKIAEIGVGSGAISIVLAKMFADIRITATDISSDALEVAKSNRDSFVLGKKIELIHTDLLKGIDGEFELIVSNPPYIADDFKLESNVVDFEPHNALFGGNAGHELLESIIVDAKSRDTRFLICEIGYDQKDAIERIFTQIGVKYYRFYRDLAGFDRGFIVQFKE